MATLDKTTYGSPGTETAFQSLGEEIERSLEARSTYPNETAFVATDLPELGTILVRYAREGRPVVLVYPNGDERLVLTFRTREVQDFVQRIVRRALRDILRDLLGNVLRLGWQRESGRVRSYRR